MSTPLTKTGPTAPGELAGDTAALDELHPALDLNIEEHPAEEPQRLDKIVFGITAVLAIGFILWGFLSTSTLSTASATGLDWVVHNMGWLFSLVASGFVLFVIWLAAGKFGRIPLGRDDEEPEFKTVSWIAMMFSAGMGIGLMFYGVSEPLSHFVTPPPGTGPAGNPEAVQNAMATTLFHWTLHPWAIYAVVGLAIAYGVFRKGRSCSSARPSRRSWARSARAAPPARHRHPRDLRDPLRLRRLAEPRRPADRLGLEIVAGLGKAGNALLVAIIVVLTLYFILSAVSGVAKGIQWLSNTNMVLAVVLAVFVFVVGPTVFILNLVPTAVGSYFQDLAMMSARTDAAGGSAMKEWLSGWTIFYWAWWVSWTPFVGIFIARISRGRTVRQFVTGVLLVPSVVSLVWFAIFGGAGIHQQRRGTDLASQATAEGSLFAMLSNLPLSTITSVIVMVLVAIFFVSGADAASIVMGTLSERGTLKPSRKTVIFWGAATGAVAAVMLIVGVRTRCPACRTSPSSRRCRSWS